MASPTSERRARLIREMAQELNSTRQSLHSNRDFEDLTGSNLSVDEESSAAYRDNSRPLPELSQKQSKTRLGSRPSADFVIDSSAIGRAFPDMTGSGSSMNDGDSISIELGRGLKDGARDLSDINSLSLGTMPGQYRTDLRKLPSKVQNRAGRSSLREVQNADDSVLQSSPPPLKATTYGTSGSSRESSGREHKHNLQPLVETASDHTGSSSGRASIQSLTARGSRFGQGFARPEHVVPKRFTSGKDLLRDAQLKSGRSNLLTSTRKSAPDSTGAFTNGGAGNSFTLPNLPNMSELVSGVYEDDTPVFSRNTASRFQQARSGVTLRPVKSLPVPQDEEAIMMSLRLLQDKIKDLEKSKADAEVTIKELQAKNRALEDERKEIRRSRRYDSGVGSSGGSDAGDEGPRNNQNTTLDKQRMQSIVRNLQSELDGANHRATVAETNASNIASERDSAIEQLGVAFVTQEELKVDCENLLEQNQALKLEVRKYRIAIKTYIQKEDSEKTDTKSKMTSNEPDQPETRSIDCQIIDVDTPGKAPVQARSRPTTSKHSKAEQSRDPDIQLPKRRKRRVVVEEYTATSDFNGFDDETIERIREASRNLSQTITQNIPQPRPLSRASSARRPAPRSSLRTTLRHNDQARDTTKVSTVQNTEDELLSLHKLQSATAQQHDVTKASQIGFLQDGDVTILRRMLEKEHLQKKGRIPLSVVAEPQEATNRVDAKTATLLSVAPPLKSALKETSAYANNTANATLHTEIEDDSQVDSALPSASGRQRRHSEGSVAARRLARPQDMTSAFILPDITMSLHSRPQSRVGDLLVDASTRISIAPEALPGHGAHDVQNCTICKRSAGACDHCQADSAEQVKASDPIPVSERIRDLALDSEEHTKRPSEPAEAALGRTIKALEDEFAHFGIQLSALQQQYNELDPSLQKSKRKSLGASVDAMRAAMDSKADQIYALYDVLEVQRKNGNLADMTEQQINDTLSSILGGDDANLGNLGMPSGIMFRRGLKTSAADVTPAKERAKERAKHMGMSTAIKTPVGSSLPRSKANKPALAQSELGNTVSGVAEIQKKAKFPWEDSDGEDETANLSWRGFDDSLDLTRDSRKSNTSSKRRSALGNDTLEL